MELFWILAIVFAILMVYKGHVDEEKQIANIEEKENEDTELLLRKVQAENMIWEMSLKDLIMIDRDRIFPEHVELVNDRILDNIDFTTPAQLKKLLPRMRRYNEGFMSYAVARIEEAA